MYTLISDIRNFIHRSKCYSSSSSSASKCRESPCRNRARITKANQTLYFKDHEVIVCTVQKLEIGLHEFQDLWPLSVRGNNSRNFLTQ